MAATLLTSAVVPALTPGASDDPRDMRESNRSSGAAADFAAPVLRILLARRCNPSQNAIAYGQKNKEFLWKRLTPLLGKM